MYASWLCTLYNAQGKRQNLQIEQGFWSTCIWVLTLTSPAISYIINNSIISSIVSHNFGPSYLYHTPRTFLRQNEILDQCLAEKNYEVLLLKGGGPSTRSSGGTISPIWNVTDSKTYNIHSAGSGLCPEPLTIIQNCQHSWMSSRGRRRDPWSGFRASCRPWLWRQVARWMQMGRC